MKTAPALLLVVACLVGCVSAQQQPNTPYGRRPICTSLGLGRWTETTEDGNGQLPSAELDYATITLEFEGNTIADLPEAVDPANPQWPVLRDGQRNNCGCCKLCAAQNELKPAPAVPCKRWSIRDSDFSCRLFGPAGQGLRNMTLQTSSEDMREWHSGTGEGFQILTGPPLIIPPGGPPQCNLVTFGGLGAGSMGGLIPGMSNGAVARPRTQSPPPGTPGRTKRSPRQPAKSPVKAPAKKKKVIVPKKASGRRLGMRRALV